MHKCNNISFIAKYNLIEIENQALVILIATLQYMMIILERLTFFTKTPQMKPPIPREGIIKQPIIVTKFDKNSL